jgi:toxin-antitoxin system PIN domain toxin
VIIPDINLLIYAYDSTAVSHAKAVAWWQGCLSGTEPVGLPSVVLFGFVRVATNPRIFAHPMTIGETAAQVRAWLGQPCAQVLETPPGHIEQTLKLLEESGTGGNLVTDAQIAALAIEYDAILHTADADFLRFTSLRWLNPLTGTRSASLVRRPH